MYSLYFLLVYLFLSIITGCASRSTKKSIQARTFYEHALLEIETGNHHNALNYINKSLALAFNHQTLAVKAKILYQIGNFYESKRIYKQLIEDTHITPILRAEILNNYACVLESMGLSGYYIWQDLIHDTSYTTPEVAHYNLGLCALRERDFSSALFHFKRAVRIAPTYADAYFYLSLTYIGCNQIEYASQALKKLLSLSPEHTVGQELLMHIEMVSGKDLLQRS